MIEKYSNPSNRTDIIAIVSKRKRNDFSIFAFGSYSKRNSIQSFWPKHSTARHNWIVCDDGSLQTTTATKQTYQLPESESVNSNLFRLVSNRIVLLFRLSNRNSDEKKIQKKNTAQRLMIRYRFKRKAFNREGKNWNLKIRPISHSHISNSTLILIKIL